MKVNRHTRLKQKVLKNNSIKKYKNLDVYYKGSGDNKKY